MEYSISIRKDRFISGENEGKDFFGVDCSKNFGNYSGLGSPCLTREEVIRTIKGFIKEQSGLEADDSFSHKPITIKNTEFINEVDELKDITLQNLFGNESLINWF